MKNLSFYKKIMFTIVLLFQPLVYADSIGSTASEASALGTFQALVGSIVVTAVSGQLTSLAAGDSATIVSAVVAEGMELAVVSVQFVGDKVQLTFEASQATAQSGVAVSKEVTHFTLEVSRSAFEASVEASGEVVELMLSGVKTAVTATPIIVEGTGVLLGCTLTLVAAPGVVIGVILTEVGKELHAS